MLLAILSTLLVCAAALAAIGVLSTHVCVRLGLHPQTVLRWLGVVPHPHRRT
jgi:hypothetical protein